jgi:hypothetical protein
MKATQEDVFKKVGVRVRFRVRVRFGLRIDRML